MLVLLLLLSLPAVADEVKCSSGDPLMLDFSPSAGRDACTRGPLQCQPTVDKLLEANHKLEAQRADSCKKLGSFAQDIADVSAQSSSYKEIADIAGTALDDSNDYLKALKGYYDQINRMLIAPGGPLAQTPPLPGSAALATAALDKGDLEKKAIREAMVSSSKLKQLNAPPSASTISEVRTNYGREDASVFAAVNGANFMNKILKEEDEVNKRIASLISMKQSAENSLKNSGAPKDPDDKSSPKNNTSSVSEGSGSGLDMKTLTGLATAGAALAPLLQKKDAPNNADNSASTSPTPGSTNDAAAKVPESSKLGDEHAQSQPPVAGNAPKKDDPKNPNRVPSGSSFHEGSDVSHSYGAASGSSTGASGGAAPARAGGGSAGSFGGLGGDGAADPAAAAAKAAAGPAGDETQGIGGGNLGGGGPPSLGGAPMGPGGDPSAAAAASAEDSMKDLLHEMKETAEGANSPNLQASNADIPMTDEDLFPRVRNAYVRALKQGRILDSLAEKVTEENQ